jgi:hypothetical protein
MANEVGDPVVMGSLITTLMLTVERAKKAVGRKAQAPKVAVAVEVEVGKWSCGEYILIHVTCQ